MKRSREFSERMHLGDLPADLGTEHGVQLRAGVPAVTRRQVQGAPGGRLLPPGAPPSYGRTVRFIPWRFATVAGSQQFLSTNDNRHYLLSQNNTGADLWMNFDSAAGVGIGIKLPDGWSAEWTLVIPSHALHFYAVAAGGAFTVPEG